MNIKRKIRVKKLVWVDCPEDKYTFDAEHTLSNFCLTQNTDKTWLLERTDESFRVLDKKTYERKTAAKKAAQDWVDAEVLKLLEDQ